jgi:hypothetical protein
LNKIIIILFIILLLLFTNSTMNTVPKRAQSSCGKTTKHSNDCVRVMNTQKRPQYGKTFCSWCHKLHKCRLLFQSKHGYDHCCSIECIVMVKQHYGYRHEEVKEETSKPMWMLCPDCCKATIDTTKVKLCGKCVKRYPAKSHASYGY